MSPDPKVERLEEHRNAFGFLRLLFASLVIVSHTPEMEDGNRSREILTRIFGTISFGELAVDGFFIISGYLIVGSFLKQPHAWAFLKKRIARIYPGFIVACAVAILIVAPLGGADLRQQLSFPKGVLDALVATLTLRGPITFGAFPGNHATALNGAMWTIAYEFRCYLLVLALGMSGALRRPWLIVLLAVACLFAYETFSPQLWSDLAIPHSYKIVGILQWNARLMGIFLMGAVFYLKRDVINFSPVGVVVAATVLLIVMFDQHLVEFGIATCGAYLIFATAKFGKSGLLSKINNRNDISYGVYLYAFPAEQLIIWHWPHLPIVLVGVLTFGAACLCGWLSWHGVEKPVMRALRRPVPTGRSVATPMPEV